VLPPRSIERRQQLGEILPHARAHAHTRARTRAHTQPCESSGNGSESVQHSHAHSAIFTHAHTRTRDYTTSSCRHAIHKGNVESWSRDGVDDDVAVLGRVAVSGLEGTASMDAPKATSWRHAIDS
jgi:hypothetical protein